MVRLIETIHSEKSYRVDTLFLAVNIADRYLANLSARGKPSPGLVLLAVTSIMIAAKARQPLKPLYSLTVRVLPKILQQKVSKPAYIALEREILIQLQFDVDYTSPIFFLERYQRLFGLDQEQSDSTIGAIGAAARNLCQMTQREVAYLSLKPSQVAAASLLMAW